MKSVTEEIAELRSMAASELVERYEVLFDKAPRCRNREHLWKRCAWKLQERRFGGLSGVAKRRLQELIAELDLPLDERHRAVSGALNGHVRRPEHKPGTVFTREWRGHDVRAVAVDGGYEHDGVVYRSLSAVAKAVTGSHWNGKLFFGLTKRKGR